ncbi:unnamed protein product, partial [marine sediment metagenome]
TRTVQDQNQENITLFAGVVTQRINPFVMDSIRR